MASYIPTALFTGCFVSWTLATPVPSSMPLLYAKWRHPCSTALPVHSTWRPYDSLTFTRVDVYLWRIEKASKQLVQLLTALRDQRGLNRHVLDADRVRQFDLPGLAAPTTSPNTASRATSWGLSSAELQRIDQQMARAAIYMELYRNATLYFGQPTAQLERVERSLSLVYSSQCRVQLLHGVLFGDRTWASAKLTVEKVVPLEFRHTRAAQSMQLLRNLVVVNRIAAVCRGYERRFRGLRTAHGAVAGRG